jgi:hypothetical protein
MDLPIAKVNRLRGKFALNERAWRYELDGLESEAAPQAHDSAEPAPRRDPRGLGATGQDERPARAPVAPS